METEHLQLYIFSDANPKSYGAVVYLRYETSKNKLKTIFVMPKPRVTPLKKLTLTLLELM